MLCTSFYIAVQCCVRCSILQCNVIYCYNFLCPVYPEVDPDTVVTVTSDAVSRLILMAGVTDVAPVKSFSAAPSGGRPDKYKAFLSSPGVAGYLTRPERHLAERRFWIGI